MTHATKLTLTTPPISDELARRCEMLMQGAKKFYEQPGPNEGNMWFFELYHHLNECALALRAGNGETEAQK